jgi:PKD repeat protein
MFEVHGVKERFEIVAFLLILLVAASYQNSLAYDKSKCAYLFMTPPIYIAHEKGELFEVTIDVSLVEDLHSVKFTLTYNASLLIVENVAQGSFFPAPPESIFEFKENESCGAVKFNMSLVDPRGSRNGNGTLALVSFRVIQGQESCASSPLCLEQTLLLDALSTPLTYDAVGALFFLKSTQTDPSVDGRSLDLYTQKGGEGPNEPGGEFVVGERVNLTSRVTYNDSPLQQKLVAFEVRNPLNESVLSRTAVTDENGLATISFIIPNILSSDGTWTAVSTVDIAGEVVWDTISFRVHLLFPPVAYFTFSPTVPFTGETITFDASLSTPDGGIIVSYEWSFGDGTPNATDMIAFHAYADNGTYTTTLTVTDSDGLADTDSQNTTVLNRPPIASFTESATTVLTGTIIYFNASSSYDPDGYIVGYFWDFGDGANDTNVTTEHGYPDNGTYTVTLTVVDDDGSTATVTANKTVLNRNPVALFIESADAVPTGTIITFNASDSFDPDGSIVAYAWDFGDGNFGSGVLISHSYADNGVYNVTLTVTDNDGASSVTSALKTVLDRPPVTNFSETAGTVYVDELINFDASTSYDPDGTIVAYFWDFGDGTNATGVTVDHGYEHNGTYTVTLTVTDDDGMSMSTSTFKNVLNRPDIAVSNVTSSKTVLGQGSSLEINVTVTNRGDRVETVNVTIYAGTTSIATEAITLTTGSSASITFMWNSTGFAYGNYTISAYAWPLPSERDTADNTYIDGWVLVTIPGDVDGNGKVSMRDIGLICKAYGSYPGYPTWDPNMDVNGDGKVDMKDLGYACIYYGQHE